MTRILASKCRGRENASTSGNLSATSLGLPIDPIIYELARPRRAVSFWGPFVSSIPVNKRRANDYIENAIRYALIQYYHFT